MTTLLHKTNAYKKARAISSGFLKMIDNFMLTLRQGLACKLTLLRSVVKHYESNDSTTVKYVTPSRLLKSAAKGGM